MKNVIIISFFANLLLTNCKTSQTVTDKDVSSVSNHFNSLPIKYGIKPETFKVNESELFQLLSSENPNIDFDGIEKGIVEYICLLHEEEGCGVEFYASDILPKLKATATTEERQLLIQNYKQCFVYPDSIKYVAGK
jgi:hypothetical protein